MCLLTDYAEGFDDCEGWSLGFGGWGDVSVGCDCWVACCCCFCRFVTGGGLIDAIIVRILRWADCEKS